MKEYAKHFYKSQAWYKCRNAYMKSVSYLCEDCYAKGIIKPAEEVHHIIFITPDNISDPNITLNYDNLISLCRECHRARHNLDEKNKRYKVDEAGRVIPKGENQPI